MPSYDISYTYDAVGNRLTKTDNLASETTTSTYDAANQLETSVDASGTTDYTYDEAGNLTTITDPSSNVTSYTWDEENRRTKVELASPSTEVVTSTYNGDGLRVKREDSSVTKKFIWDEQAYLAETDENDALQFVYTQRPAQFGGLASQRRLSGVWTTDYFLYDALGSTLAITDGSESTQETYLYDAWGNLLTSSTLEPPFLYVGELGYYADWIEGVVLDYYVRDRTCDPAMARWLSEDPIGLTRGANLYEYVANNPTSFVDPSGLILAAVDGTGSRLFREGLEWDFDWWNRRWRLVPSDDGPAGRTRFRRNLSHTRNFWEDYRSGVARFWDGPNSSVNGVRGEMIAIHTAVLNWVCRRWCRDRSQPIDMVGHSRGGYVVMEVARTLKTRGCCCDRVWFRPVPVRFLGLYDPVDMTPNWGEAETVPDNVRFASVVYAGWGQTPTDILLRQRGEPARRTHPGPYGGSRSRAAFNRADGGPENAAATNCRDVYIWGTHAALGGAPWEGDHPIGHAKANDNRAVTCTDCNLFVLVSRQSPYSSSYWDALT